MSAAGRSAAFLAEMGIGPLWVLRGAPAPGVEPVPEIAAAPAEPPAAAPLTARAAAPAPSEPQAAAPLAAPAAAPAPSTDSAWGDEPNLPATDEQIAGMDWNELRLALAGCTRCGLCKDGRKPVPGSGARSAQWLVAAGASSAADEKERQPLAGDPGKLLTNMLSAVGLTREGDVYVTNLIKCRPTTASGADRAPTSEEAAACRPYLERELVLTGAGTVLTLGQIAANALLGQPLQEALAGTRGKIHALGALPLVATLHPGELLRRGGDKALAWADLCLAKSADARSG